MASKRPDDQTILRGFTDAITGNAPAASKPLQIYEKLLRYRFEEVIDNAFERLKPFYDTPTWRGMIRELIAEGGESPYIWHLPDTFRLRLNERETRPYVHELFWFEWMDIALAKAPRTVSKEAALNPARPHRLSPTAAIRILAYPVHRREHDETLERLPPGEHPLLLFRHPHDHQVLVTEITPFMHAVLEGLDGERTLDEAILRVARAYGEEEAEVREVILPALEEMFALEILI